MATPRLGLVVEDKPTELSCNSVHTGTCNIIIMYLPTCVQTVHVVVSVGEPPCPAHSLHPLPSKGAWLAYRLILDTASTFQGLL